MLCHNFMNDHLFQIMCYVKPIGENTLPPYYSREMSRYGPPNPIKQNEREDLIEKVKEITSEESKGGN